MGELKARGLREIIVKINVVSQRVEPKYHEIKS